MINFKNLFSSLNKKKVRYLVAGGIAVNLYGIERATADIDLVVDLEESNLTRFIKIVKELGFRPKIPVRFEDFIKKENREEWINQKRMKVFSIFDPKNSYFLLDIFVETPFDFNKVYKEREKMKFENIIISVVPMKELIKMKEKAGRPQDRADVFYLKKIMKDW
ncbi:MAG: hypothetical protein HZA00_13845 [Nitrospinae bacterium]|nr:hypothetical protein [Nitrospinota bacterium]